MRMSLASQEKEGRGAAGRVGGQGRGSQAPMEPLRGQAGWPGRVSPRSSWGLPDPTDFVRARMGPACPLLLAFLGTVLLHALPP